MDDEGEAEEEILDERSIKVLGLMNQLQNEQLKEELETEIDRLKAKNAIIKAQLTALRLNMHNELSDKESAIKEETTTAKRVREANEALQDSFDLEKDRLEAAMASKYAMVTSVLMQRQAKCNELMGEVAEIKDFQARKGAILEKLKELHNKHRASEEQFECCVQSLHDAMHRNAVRYEEEMKRRALASRVKLEKKVSAWSACLCQKCCLRLSRKCRRSTGSSKQKTAG